MGRPLSAIHACLVTLVLAVASLISGQDSHSLGLDYAISLSEDGGIEWRIKDPDGGFLDLETTERNDLLREKYFPEALARAESGEAPYTWTVGFFYIDGIATTRDLEKAEQAFRRGLETDRPDGLLSLAEIYYRDGMARKSEPEKQAIAFQKSETIIRELLDAGYESAIDQGISVASVHMFGWYGGEKNLDQAESLLNAIEAVLPENPTVQLRKAKLHIYQKRYPEAYEYAEKAEQGFLALPPEYEAVQVELKRARAARISAAVLGGEISKIDPEEFLEISKDSLGLNGPMAWSIPLLLIALLAFLLHCTKRSWATGAGPELRLSIFWISAAILAAGIGFNIRLPGLDNGIGHWFGAIFVTIACLLVLQIGGWSRYFGTGPLYTGGKNLFKGLAIVVVCIVGMQLIAMGYAKLYEIVLGKALDQQLVSLFLKSENLLELAGTVLIVGIAIPFYEEIFFRGFLYDALERRSSGKAALIVSSVVFALVHGLTFFIPLLFLSFALGWLRRKNGNLRMSFFLHAANNSFSVLAGYFLNGGS